MLFWDKTRKSSPTFQLDHLEKKIAINILNANKKLHEHNNYHLVL